MTMQGIGESLSRIDYSPVSSPPVFPPPSIRTSVTGAGDVQKCSGLGEGVLTTAVLSQYMAFPRAGTLQRVCGQF